MTGKAPLINHKLIKNGGVFARKGGGILIDNP